ncbi:MAG: FAD-dependent oxidoreductase, partial [Luteolibacter sp.]
DITASSELSLSVLPPSGETLSLAESWAMMLPVSSGPMPVVSFTLDVTAPTTLRAELRTSAHPDNHTPDVVLKSLEIPLAAGLAQDIPLDFQTHLEDTRFAFVCLLKNEAISAHLSDQRLTGVLALCQAGNKQVAKSNTQSPPPGIGIDTFEFWTPKRRPLGKNLALTLDPPLRAFGVENLTNGISRPTRATNAWVADFSQEQPVIHLAWDAPQTISTVEIDFDTDFDHPMESVLMGHPERDMPFCIQDLKIAATPEAEESCSTGQTDTATLTHAATSVIAKITGNHQTRRTITFDSPVTTRRLEIQILVPSIDVPAALFAVRCFS